MISQLKMICDLLIKDAYIDDYEKIRIFNLEISEKIITTTIKYDGKMNLVKIGNLEQSNLAIKNSLIQGLTYRTNYFLYRHVGHNETYHEILEAYLISAMRIGFVNINDIISIYGRESKKINIRKIIGTRHEINLNESVVRVNDGYQYKDRLSALKFKFNSFTKTWDKLTNLNASRIIVNNLKNDYPEMDIRVDSILDIPNYCMKIIVSGLSFNYKDMLKEEGFSFNNKQWSIYKSKQEVHQFISMINAKINDQRVHFDLYNY